MNIQSDIFLGTWKNYQYLIPIFKTIKFEYTWMIEKLEIIRRWGGKLFGLVGCWMRMVCNVCIFYFDIVGTNEKTLEDKLHKSKRKLYVRLSVNFCTLHKNPKTHHQMFENTNTYSLLEEWIWFFLGKRVVRAWSLKMSSSHLLYCLFQRNTV